MARLGQEKNHWGMRSASEDSLTAQRVPGLANPELLTWARETAGFNIESVAKKLKIPTARIASWESGASNASLSQLRRLADLYKRPLAVFYLPGRPRDFQPLRDFRKIGYGQQHENSPNLLLAIRRAEDRREWALELFQALGDEPEKFRGTLTRNEAVESAAVKLRRAIGITFEAQTQWRLDYEALRNWRSTIESAGILTFQASDVETTEVRGFSISEKLLPVVVANVKDAPRGRIFTFLHEVVHVMLNEGGVCDVKDDRKKDSPTAQIEMFCNQVAGASLFPRDEFLSTTVVRSHRRGDHRWTDIELQGLSRRFGGSREAALVRLLSLNLTTWDYYLERREALYRQYQQAQQKPRGFAAPHIVAISNAGPTFTRLVAEGLNRARITASDFSDYLQIRVKHLPEVMREISQSGVERV